MTEQRSTPTTVRVHPGSLAGTLAAPGDKSLSHRVLLLAALCDDTVEVSGVSTAQDVAASADALRALGADVDLHEAAGTLAGTVTGPLRVTKTPLDCGNAGTGMRLLAGVAAGLAGTTTLTGDASLSRRPMDRIAIPLRLMGAEVQGQGPRDLPPLVVRGGDLRGIAYDSPVASAQVKSCILLAGTQAVGPTQVRSPLRSRDHTERMLRHLGADVVSELGDDGTELVRLEPGPLSARPLQASGDPSGAAFWLVASAIAGTSVTVTGVCTNPGRTGFLHVLRDLGADVRAANEREVCGEPVADVTAAGPLTGGAEVDGVVAVDSIDELPILALAGAISSDGVRVRGAAELRVKESDRIAALERTFDALGLRIDALADGFDVPGGQTPTGGMVDAHGDHRIAMTAAIAATVADAPVTITGFETVATSYLAFVADLRSLGGTIEVAEVSSV